MSQGRYQEALCLIESAEQFGEVENISNMEVLKATCLLKQHKFSSSIKVLNELKRNQLNIKLKTRCFRMRSKVFKKMGNYENALSDLQVAYTLMSP